MDKFQKTSVKINDINNQIQELISLKHKIEAGYIDLLENHFICSIKIPNLEHSNFISDWYKYHQTKDEVPFNVQQYVNVIVGGEIYSLLINNHFAIKNYDMHTSSGDIVLTDREDSYIRRLDKDDQKTNKEIELGVSTLGSKTKITDGFILHLLVRESIGEKSTDEISNSFASKSYELILNTFDNTNFKISTEQKEIIKNTFAFKIKDSLDCAINQDMKNQRVLFNDELTLDIMTSFKKALERNNMEVAINNSPFQNSSNIKKAKI